MAGYEKCVVTFLDILGFKSLLANKTPQEIATDLSLFRKFAEGDEPGRPRKMKDFSLQSQVHAEIVSDAVVRVRTTKADYQDGPFIWELLDLIHIQIECVNAGIILRGATKIGDMHIGPRFEGPIFGQALVDAYRMEDKDVVFPMIAIAEDAVLEHLSNPDLWREGNTQQDEIKYLHQFLGEDKRGILFIDYLRAAFDEIDDGIPGWIRFMGRHRDLIIRELKAGHGEPVRAKYEWLREYHNGTLTKAPQGFPGFRNDSDETAQTADDMVVDVDWGGDVMVDEEKEDYTWLGDVRSGLMVPDDI